MIVSRQRIDVLMRIYVAIFIGLVGLLLIHRWRQGEAYYFDHGIFDQALWHVAHGRLPLIDHIDIFPLNQLGDHFTPSLYLLSPLYWFSSGYESLFIVMAVLLGLTVWVVYEIGNTLKLPSLISAGIAISMSLYLGWQNGAIAGFHTEIPALLTLALALLMLERKKWRWFWLLTVVTLGFKETFVTLTISLGIYLLLRKDWKHGIALVFFSIGYFYLATNQLIPLLRDGSGYYYQVERRGLITALVDLVNHTDKVKTVTVSLVSFLGLPLLAPLTWVLFLQDWVTRFVLGTFPAWDLKLHYSLMSGLLLAYSALHGGAKIKWKKVGTMSAVVLCGLMVGTGLLITWKLQGPFGLIINRAFYPHSQTMKFLDDFARQIPNKGLVMTQNNIAVRLTHSHNVMLLREDYYKWMPDVIAIDKRPGQSPNNVWPLKTEAMFDLLMRDPNYTVLHIMPDQLIYSKKEMVDMQFYE